MLYKRRMERQLAAARGEGPAPERAPDDVSDLAFVLVVQCGLCTTALLSALPATSLP